MFAFLKLTNPAIVIVPIILCPLVVWLGFYSLGGLEPWRHRLAVATRCALLTLLALALCEPLWVNQTNEQTVICAIDRSASIDNAQQSDIRQFIDIAAQSMRPAKDKLAIIGFAGKSHVQQLPLNRKIPKPLVDVDGTDQTNIAAALRLGIAMAPTNTTSRMVLITDGNETIGDCQAEVKFYEGLGVPIDVLPIKSPESAEVIVEQLNAPSTAGVNDAVDVQLVVRSDRDTTANIILYRNDDIIDLDPTSAEVAFRTRLRPGLQRFTLPYRVEQQGAYRFRALVQPLDGASDAISQNNEGRAVTLVGGKRRLLLVTPDDFGEGDVNLASAQLLADAMSASDCTVDQVRAYQMPSDPAEWAPYSALVLSNVSASDLPATIHEAIRRYVQDFGSGLIVVGGDQSFSVGGYGGTAFEEILPVETERDKLGMLDVAVVLVIDRSGSMAGEKLSMARQAAWASAQLMSRLDQVGVLAFDSQPDWIVRLQTADNKSSIQRKIKGIGAGGGTMMYPAMKEAFKALLHARASIKHMIVLTDGQSIPGDFDLLARRCRDAKITISGVAVGPDADRRLMARIAQLSDGKSYAVKDGDQLPRIFIRETVRITNAALHEGTFLPQLRPTLSDEVMRGFTQSSIPPLGGCVVTNAKPGAEVSLVRMADDGPQPVLAYWQNGLGRVVACTTGLWPRWGKDWVAWPGFAKLWGQVVRYACRDGNPADLSLETIVENGVGRVIINADQLTIDQQNSLAFSPRIVGPDGNMQPIELVRKESGQFEGTFSPKVAGTYLLSIPYSVGQDESMRTGVLRSGEVVSYSAEYRKRDVNLALLQQMATRTGGRVLTMQDAASVFRAPSQLAPLFQRPMWETVLWISLGLFLFDVAVRRVVLNPIRMFARFRTVVASHGAPGSGERSVATLQSLRTERATRKVSPSNESGVPLPPKPSNVPNLAPAPKRELNDAPPDSRAALPEQVDKLSPPSGSTEPSQIPEQSTESEPDQQTTARLLKARRNRNKE